MNLENKISRNDFLKKIGFTGASLFALYTLDSCVKETGVTPSGSATLDLSMPSNAALKNNGGYVIVNGIVVAKHNGEYIAATLTCSHEDKNQIIFKSNEWYCTAHGARFNTAGKGLNSDAKKGLGIYKTSLSGNILTITA